MIRRTPRILVVDDDPAIRRTLASELRSEQYDVSEAADGREALAVFERDEPDLVLTDLAMPVADGFEVVAGIRKGGTTPVLVLSVRGADDDKIRALDLGADDYVTKPFSLPELLARVRSHLRRSGVGAAARLLRFEDLSIDLERRRVVQGGRDVKLTPTELSILELLASNAGKPVTIARIIGRVWRGAAGTTPDTVRVHVGSMRRKIEPDPSSPRYVVTEPWVGYRFVAEPVDSGDDGL